MNEFWRFVGDNHLLGQPMAGTYSPWLVVLSLLVASLGAYTALAVVDRIRATPEQWVKMAWLLSGALAFGCGVWAMHFVGMLAFSLPIQISYKLSFTLISIAPAIFGSGIALYVMSQNKIKWWRLQLGALLMALGIGTMHYTGMEAMQLDAMMRYDLVLFVVSILAAHVLASIALYIKFFFHNRSIGGGVFVRLGSAVAMGAAVTTMHYTAMASAQFFPTPSPKIHSVMLPPTELGIFVVIVTSLIIGFAIVGTIVDRRLAEASDSVRESEKFATLLLESAGEGICGIDKGGNITFVNPAAANMLDFDGSELISSPFSCVSQEKELFDVQRGNGKTDPDNLQKTGVCLNNTKFTRKDGKEFSVEFIRTSIKKGETSVGYVVTFRDITERLQAENDLRESEEKFRQIAEQTQDALCLTSPDGMRVVYISPAYEKIWGCTRDSLYSKSSSWMDAVHPDDQHQVRSTFLNKAVQGEEYTEEFRIIRPDGSICWILDHCFPIRDACGNIKHIAWFAQDISERKQMETELRLAQKLEAVGQLAAGVAHEINTPVQYVGDNIEFLEQTFSQIVSMADICTKHCEAAQSGDVNPDLVKQMRTALDEVDISYLIEEAPKAIAQSKEGVQQIAKIVQAMKAFSHPGGDNMEDADLNAIIKNTITVTRSEWKYVAEIVLDLDTTIPEVPCYSQAIGQVILNLIVNAAHAIRDVVDQKSGEKGTITVSSALRDEMIQVCVADTGRGIPEAVHHKVFDPFFTTKDVGVGTGQGLALARTTIVDAHGGTLDFETSEDNGTKFIIGLKIKNADQKGHENAT